VVEKATQIVFSRHRGLPMKDDSTEQRVLFLVIVNMLIGIFLEKNINPMSTLLGGTPFH